MASSSMLNRKFVIRLLLSLLVSAFLIFLSLRNADLKSVGAAMAHAEPWPIIGYSLILLGVHLVKTLRWWLLLVPIGPTGFRRVNAASAVGFMLLVLMPLRLGELARPLIVSRPSVEGEVPLRRGAALASCVVERVVDMLAMGVLGIISLHMLAASGHSAELARRAATIVTAGVGFGCVGMVVAFFLRLPTVRFVQRLLNPLSPKLAERVSRLVDGFILGLHVGSLGRLLAFLGLTATYWALHVWGFWMVAGAFGLPLSPLMACTVLASQVVGIMIPAGPGMVGTSQFFTQLGLSIFIPGALSVPAVASRAAAYANTIWLLQFGQQVLTGLPFLLGGRVSLQGLFERREPEPEPQPALDARGGA
jgi:glycosyltransferase 2 family protein